MDLSRRAFLRMAFSACPSGSEVLIQVFLRGGADGLNLVPPVGDPGYLKARPVLGIKRPIDLDGFFGLHPSLAPLLPIWQEKELAIVHAVGSEDQTRSHFEAQDLMERACPVNRDLGSGWIARLLRAMPGSRSPLAAVAIADVLPESLRGSPGASAVRSVDSFALHLTEAERPRFVSALGRLYREETNDLGRAGLQVLETLETVDRLRRETADTPSEAGPLAGALRQIARLIRAEVGLEVACVDVGGWDTHFVQASLFDDLARELATSLASFCQGLGEFRRRVIVVVMTEFGRRLQENVSLGTDHGRGSVMFVLGGRIKGGRVVHEWPGLGEDQLEGPGDLRVTIDYRDILAELAAERVGDERLAEVFPGFKPTVRGVVR